MTIVQLHSTVKDVEDVLMGICTFIFSFVSCVLLVCEHYFLILLACMHAVITVFTTADHSWMLLILVFLGVGIIFRLVAARQLNVSHTCIHLGSETVDKL